MLVKGFIQSHGKDAEVRWRSILDYVRRSILEWAGGSDSPWGVEELLHELKDVFEMTNMLLPSHEHKHAIVLQEGVAPISVQPCLHLQKDKIENLI